MLKRSSRMMHAASKAATKLLFRPMFPQKKQRKGHLRGNNNKSVSWYEFLTEMSWSKFEAWLFPHMPEHYPLSKKLFMAKSQSVSGKLWDVLLIVMSLLACAIYVSETYTDSWESVQIYGYIEIVVTQFFAADVPYKAC